MANNKKFKSVIGKIYVDFNPRKHPAPWKIGKGVKGYRKYFIDDKNNITFVFNLRKKVAERIVKAINKTELSEKIS